MPRTCQEIMAVLEDLAPPALAEAGDRVGLQFGRPELAVERVLVCLDVTPAVLAEAERLGAQMLVCHHPPIWQPLTSLREDRPAQALAAALVRQGLAVYVLHTNWDKAPGGVSACLARALGLEQVEALREAEQEPYYKLVTFVPAGYEDAVREALAAAGAGIIGAYSHCSFQIPGTGTFKPLEGASPFLGTVGQLEKVGELRLEMILPRERLGRALRALRQAHPYEEVAYDVYPLANRQAGAGLGAVGDLPGAGVRLADFVERVKAALGVSQVRFVGDPERPVRRVAVCGGSGGDLVALARRRRAEVLVTGDVKYHQALEAQALDLAVIDAGHGATERVSLPYLAAHLQKSLPGLEVAVSSVEVEPWRHG